jgi:hypothetical protein
MAPASFGKTPGPGSCGDSSPSGRQFVVRPSETANPGDLDGNHLVRRSASWRCGCQAIAKHLAQLSAADLIVAGNSNGRRIPYRLDPEPIRQALSWLATLANRRDERLDALARHLDAS